MQDKQILFPTSYTKKKKKTKKKTEFLNTIGTFLF